MVDPHWFQGLSRADFLRSVGLYVTPERVFLVRMRKSLLRLSLLEAESREIPAGEDQASRKQDLSEALRSFLRHFDPAKDPLYICLSPDQVVTQELFLPPAAEENLAQVVEYEVERHLPFRRQEVYYDFLPMGRKGDKVGLLLVAVPKRIVDEILDVLADLGIRPRGVEATVTALSNYFLCCSREISGPALLLGGQNQDWEMIGLNAKNNGWRQEAELVFSYWLPHSEWIKGPGRELFHSTLRGSPKFFCWGDAADYLQSASEESLYEDLLELGKRRLGGDKGLSHPSFLPAIGAALRGLREATFTVNLLPGAKAEGQDRALSWVNAALTLLLLAGLIVWGGSYPLKDEIRLRQLQREIKKIAPSVEALSREERELNRLRKEIDFFSGFRERRGVILRLLDELSRIVPNTAYVSNLRFREGTVELQGSAESASNLVPLLERSASFENVTFNAPSSRGRDNRETFSLKAEIEGFKGGKAAKP
jgi:general secretion pathway protein L